ncbi:ribose-phosphate diphosphokinase [Marinobacter zhejiangensis]|uniref:Ribose-phosphate pyrophosphokinase n=1 Tax=Marinobacter zhejiangensis TaxID=488535 RepID=A0A1I4PES4_9GAMM|nr:ribose-phosphate diphosphokinase [Marinobacter zhejiangensis]SFM26170.1 ribose-phosphate pyrophosphokinase [Marinobacter zhejiangensis]
MLNEREVVFFSLTEHPLTSQLVELVGGRPGEISTRRFPDGETYLRVMTPVSGLHCVIVADMTYPDDKFLALIYLADTLKELGAASVGLVVPYLPYMRQDVRFQDGEAVTSRLFARLISQHLDWLVTVDPHLHRYHSLDEIYSIPSRVVQGAPALTEWLKGQTNLLLVGPDAESEQWVSGIAALSGHPFVIGEKRRYGDRQVEVSLPDMEAFTDRTAMVIDDVISSGHTILECVASLKARGITRIQCAAIHGIFADQSDARLRQAGLDALVTCNTVVHNSNRVNVAPLLAPPINELLAAMANRQLL